MFGKVLLAAVVAGLIPFGAAHADAITTFDLDGDLGFGGKPDLSGTIRIDTTNGSIVDASLITTNPTVKTYSRVESDGYVAQYGAESLFVSSASGTYIALLIPVKTLVDYSGGDLASHDMPSPTGYVSDYNDEYQLLTGSLTPIPEPASIAVLGVGLLGSLAVCRRKRVRSAG